MLKHQNCKGAGWHTLLKLEDKHISSLKFEYSSLAHSKYTICSKLPAIIVEILWSPVWQQEQHKLRRHFSSSILLKKHCSTTSIPVQFFSDRHKRTIKVRQESDKSPQHISLANIKSEKQLKTTAVIWGQAAWSYITNSNFRLLGY